MHACVCLQSIYSSVIDTACHMIRPAIITIIILTHIHIKGMSLKGLENRITHGDVGRGYIVVISLGGMRQLKTSLVES